MPEAHLRRRPTTLPRLAASLCVLLLTASLAGAETPRFEKAEIGPLSYESTKEALASEIWRALAAAHDFDVVFSPKMHDPKLDFRASDTTLGELLDRLALTAGHFWRPLDERTVLVAADTPQSRRAYEPEIVKTVRLESIRVKDAMTVLRSIYGIKHITADESRQTLTLRDLAPKVELATGLLSQLDVPEDEVKVRLELIRLPADAWRERGTDIDRLRSNKDTVLSADLAIVGHRGARFDVEERAQDSGDRFAVGVEIEARVHPESREITLALDSRLAKVDAESGEVAASKETRSSWRLESGETHIVELPGGQGLGGDDTVLALVLTPDIVRATSQARQAQWISAAVPFRSSGDATSEAASEEVEERLRQRLANLPRGEGRSE